MRGERRVPEVLSFCGNDGGGATQLDVFLLLACNSLILVVCCLIFGASEADSRAELALRGVGRERGLFLDGDLRVRETWDPAN